MIYFYSDIVIHPLLESLRKNIDLEIRDIYTEDLISSILKLDAKTFTKEDILIIHSDQYFHRKGIEWQNQFLNALDQLANGLKCKIILTNMFAFSYQSAPVSRTKGWFYDIFDQQAITINTLLEHSNVFLFDFLSVCSQIGFENSYNFNLGHLYQMPYTKPLLNKLAQEVGDFINWLFKEEKKVIVLDCDNTLWGGILGEVGIEKINCDLNSEGIIYFQMQSFLKEKMKEGFLLTLCSKNNENEVISAFESKNMPLKWDDFVVKKVNWNDKWQNIQEIADELKLGLNSFVFIDDNQFELNSVKEIYNEIETILMKPNIKDLNAITKSYFFRRKYILADDLKKTQQYKVEQVRKTLEEKSTSFEEFIKNLEIKMDIRLNDQNDFERLSQMTGKINQFNFNKREFTVDDLIEFIEAGNRIYSLKVSDKFGDYGTVGLILVKLIDNNAIIENYLMSCRVLGKGIENDFYNEVINKLKNENINLVDIKFVKTERNEPAQKFVKEHKMNILIKEIEKVFQIAFNSKVMITLETKKEDIPEWNSLNHLNLIVELEDNFNVNFTKDEIVKINSVKSLVEILTKKLKL